MNKIRIIANCILGVSVALNIRTFYLFVHDFSDEDGRRTNNYNTLLSHRKRSFFERRAESHSQNPQRTQELSIQNKSATSRSNINQQQNVRLEFIHNPKAAGSAVEKAAWDHGVKWGYNHFANSANETRRSRQTIRFMKEHHKLPPWHLPSCLLDNEPAMRNPYQPTNHNERVHLFTVVRNPYDRAVSEYRYLRLMIRNKRGGPFKMNRFIRNRLRLIEQAQRNASADSCQWESHTENYFKDSGHWIPQFDFVFHTNGKTNETSRIVHHVLKYENLPADFANLMDQYGLEHFKLAPKGEELRTHENRNRRETRVQPDRLSSENIHTINRIYRKDFEAFGYEMLHPPLPPQVMNQTSNDVSDEEEVDESGRDENSHDEQDDKLENS